MQESAGVRPPRASTTEPANWRVCDAHDEGGERLRARVGHQLDIIYVGFVLGHGGDALQMLSLAHGMRLRGANVKIIVPNTATTAAFPARCAAVGIECERSDLITADMEGARQSLRAVIRLLRSLDAPLVHFHTGNSCLPRKVMLALELLRFRPAFVTIHSPYETIVPGGARARFWAGTAGRRFLAVVSPSKHATFFQERCGLRSDLALTVRNTIDIETAASGDGRGPRAELGVDADDPIVLFCSRIDAQKRPVDAVQAFAAVADEFPKALLVFVGVGDCVDAVALEATRLGVHGRVRLLGYQTNVPDWLA
ncbi:MAG: hypothetical protein QOD72_1106, partial [Acidimicrobiaceae bacterium]|nr:hypothetical protein [Acidimicrobiaceae bacterium]